MSWLFIGSIKMVKVKTSVVNNEAKTEAAGTTVKRKIPSNKLKKV